MITIEDVKANIIEGWKLNPNDKIVKAIIGGLNRNGGECPCHNIHAGTPDAMCPCKSYRENNHCCCTLYVKKDE